MKKKNIINLIRYHTENNETGFRNEAYEIARDFDSSGDGELSEYIMSLLSDANTFIPQMNDTLNSDFLEKLDTHGDMLLLPDGITNELLGMVNAVDHHVGINKFLFEGEPGTGKTEAAKQLARIMQREAFMVNFSALIDSKLGQTQKNVINLFKTINNFAQPEKVMILFDEIDAIAMDRTNSNDLREMGRTTSTLLKCLDRLNDNIVLVATTNLYQHFDKALIRRFDTVLNFNQYSRKDLLEIAEKILNDYLERLNLANHNIRLFRKIMGLMEKIPYPGDLKNLIRTSVAFSDPKDGLDYFRRLYYNVTHHKPDDLVLLKQQGFTVREIEILMRKSKSSVSRELSEVKRS
ncbi:MAG: ATP-binding protein [Lachnospiraceae bacterium]|jgi:SpoVK/Ycf46/Vps4 family AAA+-type ATPase|nr:ATP-binding protein [Lachnospiraceae bacterium]MCH4063800.1 ATP-binding protein [Lachnospiraceae bacterium]MCH4103477.1 ATP-binding protein [Lachnospiraceae bacterium]MCI1310133.1 ATP-binding protein [Lachnospiraceae bacterium]MCI1334587.1 ATP-binding protein [Lachnospiraceae bacterium]